MKSATSFLSKLGVHMDYLRLISKKNKKDHHLHIKKTLLWHSFISFLEIYYISMSLPLNLSSSMLKRTLKHSQKNKRLRTMIKNISLHNGNSIDKITTNWNNSLCSDNFLYDYKKYIYWVEFTCNLTLNRAKKW